MKKLTSTLIITIMILISTTVSAGELDNLAAKQNKSDFFSWLQDKNNHAEVYFIPQNTFTSKSRERYIEIFNRVQSCGGSYTRVQIKKWGCDYLNGWSAGRIIERKPNSKIVKIEYRWPRSQQVNYGWVHIGVIETMDSYRSRLAK